MTGRADALTEAYHVIYDVKDTLTPGGPGWVPAYEALGSLAALMANLDIDVPRRYDGTGRPTTETPT